LYEREISSRLGPRTTRAPLARRVPIATSLCPDRSGATSGMSPRRFGRQVDVHVADDPRLARRPGGAQRPPAALALEAQDGHVAQLGGERAGDGGRRVGARVVGDDDPPCERERLGQEAVQAAHGLLEGALLVVDGHDDVDVRRRRGPEVPPQGERGAEGGFGHVHSVGGRRGRAVGGG
jgi:hypothetical protein